MQLLPATRAHDDVGGYGSIVPAAYQAQPKERLDGDTTSGATVRQETRSRRCAPPRTMEHRDPQRVALAYTAGIAGGGNWFEFFRGRSHRRFLYHGMGKGADYRLIKEMWTFGSDRIEPFGRL